VPIRLDLAACHTRDYDRDKVIALFQDLAFRSLVARLPTSLHGEPSAEATQTAPPPEDKEEAQLKLFPGEPPETEPHPTGTFSVIPEGSLPGTSALVSDPETLAAVAARLSAATIIAFDTESTSTDPQMAELVGVAVAWGTDAGEAAYIPIQHRDAGLPWEKVRAALKEVFGDARIAKVAHNASYDVGLLKRYGLLLDGELVDTMVAAWLIDPGSRGLGLKDLAWTRLKTEMTPISELIGSGKNQVTMDAVPATQAAAYASADACVTLRLANILVPELAERGLTHLFREIEMPLVPVLVAMEAAGIKVDVAYLQQMSVELSARLVALEREIHQIAGRPFNINSTQQLADVLFGQLGCPPGSRRRRRHLRLRPMLRLAAGTRSLTSSSSSQLGKLLQHLC
jgi:DNA polymerase-1